MNNKTYILSTLEIDKAQWNADFGGGARRTSDGKIFATDKARKYSIRQEFGMNQVPVLIKKHVSEENPFKYKSLTNILKEEGITLSKKADMNKYYEAMKILYNKYIDLRIFGFILNPNSDFNFSSHGSFQIYYANDIFKEESINIPIKISSYKPSDEKDGQTTIGTQYIIDKGFVNYSMCLQPNIYLKEASKIFGEDYDEEKVINQYLSDKEKFLEVISSDVSNLNSCSKNGVSNLFNIVIDMKSDKSLNVSNLKDIQVSLNQGVKTVDLQNVLKVLEIAKDDIEKVELYFSEADTLLDLGDFIEQAKKLVTLNIKELM